MARQLHRGAVILSALALAIGGGGPSCKDDDDRGPAIELVEEGVRVAIQLEPFELTLRDGTGREVLRTLSGGGADPYGGPAGTRDDGPDGTKGLLGWDGYHPEERPWSHGGKARVVDQTATSATVELDAGSGRIAMTIAAARARVSIKTTVTSANAAPPDAWNKTTLSFALADGDHFFGLGERYASVDHRGLSLYAWAEEGGTGRGEKVPADEQNPFPNGPSMTYFPIPFFFSSEGYAMHLATTARTETHLGSERKDAWRVAVNESELEVVVYVHDDPLASLDDFTRDTGRPLVPASWVFGPRRRVGMDDRVAGVEEWRKLREARVPTTGLDDNVHFLPARSELGHEEALRAWTKRAHEWGYKVMAYNNPYVSISKPEAATDLKYGSDHGLFAKTPEGAVAETELISGEPQRLATIDLTNAEAVRWFQDLLRRTIDLGYDGWMHDFGEYVRRPWTFADGRTGAAVHNEYPVLSAKAAHDLLAKEKPNDFLFFVRAGYTGTQRWVPAVWGGDPEATFDETQGLPAMLRGGLNLGMSGVPIWGSDTTGFKCITDFPHDKEMHLRWAEMSAVSPIMQQENACSNPLGRQQKWQLWDDAETVSVYADMARLHTRLLPYFEVLAREAARSGVPIMRHPFLLHPKDPEAWTVASAFYLGPALWAAPVVERGATSKETWLPPGRWVELVDHAVYDGGRRVILPAPLARLPLLVRDGGIVPLLDASVETLAPATEPSVVTAERTKDRLDVVVALSPGREAAIGLADGTRLYARRSGGDGGPSALTSVTADALPLCDGGCVLESSEPSIDRLRLTTPLAPRFDVTHRDITLEASGPLARRVRWDVLRLR